MALIEIRGLSTVFGPHPQAALEKVRAGMDKPGLLATTGHVLALDRIELDIEGGEIFVIMGLSGSGKSTLVRHINRLIDPTEGTVRIAGEDVTALPIPALIALRRRRLAMVFQRFGLHAHRSVLDNVAYGLEIRGVPRAQRENEARAWIERVGLAGVETQYPAQLSGGMQQRVGLARALCAGTDIILMDEAFSALDPLIRSQLQGELLALQATLGKTVVFITHDLDEALRIGNRIAILKDGALVQVGHARGHPAAPGRRLCGGLRARRQSRTRAAPAQCARALAADASAAGAGACSGCGRADRERAAAPGRAQHADRAAQGRAHRRLRGRGRGERAARTAGLSARTRAQSSAGSRGRMRRHSSGRASAAHMRRR